jgi:hypothetical protein
LIQPKTLTFFRFEMRKYTPCVLSEIPALVYIAGFRQCLHSANFVLVLEYEADCMTVYVDLEPDETRVFGKKGVTR